MTKVYCEKCKHFYYNVIGRIKASYYPGCKFDYVLKDTWKKIEVSHSTRNPKELNKNNDCKDYEFERYTSV